MSMDLLNDTPTNDFESFFADEDFGGVEASYNRIIPSGILLATLVAGTTGLAMYKMKDPSGNVTEQQRPVITLVHELKSHIKAAPGEPKLDDVEVSGLRLTTKIALISKVNSPEELETAKKLYKARAAAILETHGVKTTGNGLYDEYLQQIIGATVELPIKRRADKKNPGVFYTEADLFTKGAVKFLEHTPLG